MEVWYAVQTKPRQERVAAEHLTRQHYHIYLPMMRSPKRRRGHWCDVIEPLFPGYLFIRLDLKHQNAAPIRSTRGVTGLVSFGGAPVPAPKEMIEGLIAAQTEGEEAILREHLFNAGDRVEIVSGPLAGLQAIFLAQSGRTRALLLLELLGRNNRFVVADDQLVPRS